MKAEDAKKETRVRDTQVAFQRLGTIVSDVTFRNKQAEVQVKFDNVPFEENRMIIHLAKA